MAIFTRIDQIEPKEIIPGFHGRMVHTDNVTFAHWDIEAGSVLPEHHHVHEAAKPADCSPGIWP